MPHSSADLTLLETDHWRLVHRPDTTLPGYLLIFSKHQTTHLWELPAPALEEMGGLLSRIQQTMMEVLKPNYLYMGRYGHFKGTPFHFHFIPVYDWIVEGFLQAEPYRSLKQFHHRHDGVFEGREFDPLEIQLYIWREFCENTTSPRIHGPSLSEVLEKLRLHF